MFKRLAGIAKFKGVRRAIILCLLVYCILSLLEGLLKPDVLTLLSVSYGQRLKSLGDPIRLLQFLGSNPSAPVTLDLLRVGVPTVVEPLLTWSRLVHHSLGHTT